MARTRSAGGISVKILADDKDFQQKLKQASRVVSQRAKEMRAAFNTVGNHMLKLGTVAAGALTAGLVIASHRIDAMAKHASKIGIVTSELQSLRYAAEQTGVASSVMDTALQRMVRRISEAAQGGGPAAKALQEMGLSAEKLAKLSPDKQFRAITEAMGGVSRQGDKVRMAMALFDTEGVALVNTMALGVEGLDEMNAKMERFGVLLNAIDTAKVEEANDAFGDLKVLQEGLFNQLSVQVSPVLSEITAKLIDMVEETGGMGNVAEKTFGYMVEAGGRVGDVIWGWSLAIAQAQIGMAKLVKFMADNEIFNKGNPVSEALFVAESKAFEMALFKQAERELIESGEIESRGLFRAGRNPNNIDDPEIQSINEYVARNRDSLAESIGQVEPVAPEHLRGPRDTTSDDIAKEMEKLISELQGKLDERIANGPYSNRIREFVDEAEARAEERARRKSEADNLASEKAAKIATDELSNSMEAASKSAAKAGDALMSMSEIASKGTGWFAKLAGRSASLREQAEAARASGRHEAADKLDARADRLELEARLREQGYDSRTAREIAKQGVMPMEESGAVALSEVSTEGKRASNNESKENFLSLIYNEIKGLKENIGIA